MKRTTLYAALTLTLTLTLTLAFAIAGLGHPSMLYYAAFFFGIWVEIAL